MPCNAGGYGSGRRKKKWRYPGVPIPERLKHRYEL